MRGFRNHHSIRRRAMSRGGFLELDVLAGLIIVAALTIALGAVLGRQHRAVQKLADARAAAQVAEAVLDDLRAGRPRATPAESDLAVEVRPAGDVDAGASGADEWVEVVVRLRGGRAALAGLVPRGAAGQGGGASEGNKR